MAAIANQVEVVKKLIPKYTNPNYPNGEEISPMLLACKFGNLEVVKLLAAHTKNPNEACVFSESCGGGECYTPIHYAGSVL